LINYSFHLFILSDSIEILFLRLSVSKIMIHSMEITMDIAPYMCYSVCRLTTRRTAVRLYKSVCQSPTCQDESSSVDVSSSVSHETHRLSTV
jgi:hypothetical protein